MLFHTSGAQLLNNPGNVRNLLIQDHHLIKWVQILTLEKLSSKELYSILITKFTNKPSSNVYFEKYFLIWNLIGEIFIFYRMYSVQYKILNKSSLTFCFGIRSYLFFERKIHHYALSVIKKKIHCCISLLNVHLRFTF